MATKDISKIDSNFKAAVVLPYQFFGLPQKQLN